MPPPVWRHTLASAARASFNDEKLRKDKVEKTAAANNAKIFGTTVVKVDSRVPSKVVDTSISQDASRNELQTLKQKVVSAFK